MSKKTSPPWELHLLAGKSALEHIQKKGLSPGDIRGVVGASGAAKWLSLYGLDRWIFSQWLSRRPSSLHLFGTSIGAWKLCAAARQDPGTALDRLRTAYIRQHYKGRPTPAQITRESLDILDRIFPDSAIEEVLSHPRLRVAFGTIRCRGPLGSKHLPLQAAGLLTAYGLNRIHRRRQRICFERVVFHHPDYDQKLLNFNDFPTRFVPLTRKNFKPALLASGSIPLYMDGISHIPGAPKGTYRDGGLLDYHPAPPLAKGPGILLYPHFYPHLTRGWFDKGKGGQKAQSPLTDHMLVVAPSPAFVQGLPHGRIPDRKDFERFQGRDTQRMGIWNRSADQCSRLALCLARGIESGAVKDWIHPLP